MSKSFEDELAEIEKKLVTRLAAEREKAKMTRAELSEAIGAYRTLITKLETGNRDLDAALLVKIARGLKLKPSTLMRRVWDEVEEE